ncbi:DUF434 domain-containing protein [Rapidithrix thailandica]|uniref:DUF434 domain-containing protein n=1 Tax=Rapidithrix thailandica TaxID=413964 RepID=A0AAW9S0I1_9BACT
MAHHQKHRGANPKDHKLFTEINIQKLKEAIYDLSLLLSREYPLRASLKLVGDKYKLTERQRLALTHSVCSEQARQSRAQKHVPLKALQGEKILVDGYNLLITTESILSNGPVFRGLDQCYRDIASIHGTYRKVEETLPALKLIGQVIQMYQPLHICWVLDAPISNSGRLRKVMEAISVEYNWNWEVLIENNPDRYIAEHNACVAVTSDSWILDNVKKWTNPVPEIIRQGNPDAWIIHLDS